jgi:hypothetical protein
MRPAVWLALLVSLPGHAAAPPPGRYDGAQLCVANGEAAPTCGEVKLEWRHARRARLRVSDVVYTLVLRTSAVDVTLQHGLVRIDEFTAAYDWDGDTLRFTDEAKNVRYEVRPRRLR